MNHEPSCHEPPCQTAPPFAHSRINTFAHQPGKMKNFNYVLSVMFGRCVHLPSHAKGVTIVHRLSVFCYVYPFLPSSVSHLLSVFHLPSAAIVRAEDGHPLVF
jgi:hypothetical protein